MRIAVLGVGSIGGVVLGALCDTDADLVAVSRGGLAANLAEIGLILHTPEGTIEMIPPERFIVVDSGAGPVSGQVRGTCEAAIICGKAASTSVLAQLAEELLVDDGVAVSIQNGLGHSETLARSRESSGRLDNPRCLARFRGNGSLGRTRFRSARGAGRWQADGSCCKAPKRSRGGWTRRDLVRRCRASRVA